MRGGFIHAHILLAPIVDEAKCLGMQVACEAPIHVQGKIFYGDLLIVNDSQRILVEAEMSPRRVGNDLVKAAALHASELWIVVPNPRVARSIWRKLSDLQIELGIPGLFVLLLPQALQRLRDFI